MADGHVLRGCQSVDCLLDADVVVGQWTETGKLYQVVVTFHRPFISDGNGIDGGRIVKIHPVVVDGEVLGVLRALQVALLELAQNAPRGIRRLALEARQLVVLAARTDEGGKVCFVLVQNGGHLLETNDGMSRAGALHLGDGLLDNSIFRRDT